MKVTIRKFSEEELAEQAFMAKLNSKTFDLWTIEEREQFIAVLETKPVPYGDCTSDGRFVSILESIPRSDWTEKQTKRYRKVKESKFDKYVDDSRYKEVLEQTPLAEWTGTEKSHYLTMVKREKDKKAIVQEEERRNREVERLLAQKQGIVSPISDNADSPHQIQAATGQGVPDIIYGERADIEDSDGTPANVRDNDAIKAINELTAATKEPRPVYFVPTPKNVSLDSLQTCPVDGKEGFWESQEEYAIRVELKSNVLTAYRKTSEEGTRWSKDGTWGESKKGDHVFKKIDPSKPNSKYLYFVRTK